MQLHKVLLFEALDLCAALPTKRIYKRQKNIAKRNNKYDVPGVKILKSVHTLRSVPSKQRHIEVLKLISSRAFANIKGDRPFGTKLEDGIIKGSTILSLTKMKATRGGSLGTQLENLNHATDPTLLPQERQSQNATKTIIHSSFESY
jgi:hypothetical protein